MIELKGVKKIYTTKIGETAALDGVSLSFPDKGLIFITGKSGSGKTTMLNVIGGLDGFEDGEIIIDGRSFKDLSAKDYDTYRNTYIGVVFQEYNLLPEYTVEKNIKIATELQGVEATDEQVDALLEQVEILEYKKRLPNQLSGGQMQRVAIARALIKDPHIILADEPTGALDSNTGIQVIETLKKLSENKLVIIVSHDLELAEKYADRIISLKDGKVVSDQMVQDVVVEGGIYEGENFCVKSGAKLTDEEGKKLIKAVEDGKKIEITKTLKVREKKTTGEVKDFFSKGNKRELVSSKMKFKSSAWLGLKSLSVKPVRLIITILLAVIAFGLFGIIDSVATYDRQKIIFHNLKDSGFSAIVSSAKYVNPQGDSMNIKFSETGVNKLNSQTGYKFKGVYSLKENTTSNVQEKCWISQIPKNTRVNEDYFYKYINGQIEFDSGKITEIQNEDGSVTQYITENGFNYKVLHGKYPCNKLSNGSIDASKVNYVGISSYIAESILTHCGQEKFGDKTISSISDLIGRTFDVGTGRIYTIECIIDCGKIPDRYSVLRKGNDKGQYDGLKNELLSFLSSGTHLNIFTDTGHFDYYLKQKNSVQTYRMPAGTTVISVQGKGVVNTNYRNEWYKISDIPTKNYLTFSESTIKLEGGVEKKGNVTIGAKEALIDAQYIDVFFKDEIVGLNEDVSDVINTIKNNGKSFEEKRVALTYLIKKMENYKLPEDKECGLLGKPITHKVAKIEQKFDSSGSVNVVNLKIVGIYFGINTNGAQNTTTPSVGHWILAVNESDMQSLRIYQEQGSFSRIISPVISNSNARKVLSKMMCSDDGVVIDWFNNSIISMLEGYKAQIEPAFELLIYLDVLISVFAVFMLTNYISTSIIQKKQTIGILRALGSGGKDIFIIFIIESLVIAVINGIIATLFGYAGCIFVNTFIRNEIMINVSFAIFEIRQALIIFFSSVITAIFASLIPIIRICKRKPVELIRKSY